ncbi:MAG: AAA family ATPase [Chloroflexi bacterium]|nr:AAA family ATPase [Chloroflexota bacterium]
MKRLRQALKLSDFDVGVIVLCLAPELDKTYELLYALLQDDVGKSRPTGQLALQILADSLEDRIRCRQSFSPGAPLLKYDLVQMTTDPYCQSPGSLSKSLNLDPRVLGYLLGVDFLDDQLGQFASIWEGEQSWSDVVLPAETKSRFQELPVHIERLTESDRTVLLQFFGPAGCGKQTASRAVCHALNRRMLTIDLDVLLTCGQDISNLLHRAHREALLQEAIIFFRNSHHLSGHGPQERMLAQAMEVLMSERREVTIMSGHTPWIPFGTAPDLA